MFEAEVCLRCFLYSDTLIQSNLDMETASFLRTERTISRSGPSDLQRQRTNEIRSQVTAERRVEERCHKFSTHKSCWDKYIKFKDRKQQGNSHHKFSFKFTTGEATKLKTAPGSPGNIHCLVGGGIVVVPLCKASHVPSVQVELFAWPVLSANPHQVEG